MNAAKIAAALGGAYRSGAWWRSVCPSHGSRTGHSATPALRDGERGLIVHCHAGCGLADILAELRGRGLLAEPANIARLAPPKPRRDDDASHVAAARRLWDAARDARGSPVEHYLAGRAITMPPPSSLRWAPCCWHREARARLPAMVARVEHAERGIVGVHRTYLHRDDAGTWRRRDRASLGPISGGAVRLAPAADELLIGEGVETCLSAMQATRQPAWAALSTSGMATLILPAIVRHVIILADNDPSGAGERAAYTAADRWLTEGRRVRIALPPVIGTDWADVLTGREQVVYLRNADYVPRAEAPSGSTGGKKVYIDKVIWRYIPDPWEAAEALAAREMDWWQEPEIAFIPKIEQNPDLQTFLFDPLGAQGWLRPNWLHPPFNNKKARQALVHMMDQVTYLSYAIGPSEYYRPCYSVFACGGPYETRIGATPIVEHDLFRARELVKESGYDGRPLVVLQITDRPFLNAAAIVTRQRLESIGFKVILKAMDWSTNLVARTRKEPPDRGGWNLLHTWWQASDVINPAVHFGLSGAGQRGWFGWPEIPQIEKVVTDWVRAPNEAKRQQLADEAQRIALDEVTYVPWGQWLQPTAFRKRVRDVPKFAAPVFWNVKLI